MSTVVIVGAGAAGTMAAIFAASAGANVVLLESTTDGGRKILISGGGRCNILPIEVDDSRFVTESSPHTLRKIVRSWPLREQIAFFEREAGIPLMQERASGKLFPRSQSGRDVRDRLMALARSKGVTLETGARVTGFAPRDTGWQIDVEGKPSRMADALVLATGGLSVPSTGSDGAGLDCVRALGLPVRTTYAALTPLTAAGHFQRLSGVSLPVTLSARAGDLRAEASGGFLFTHKGYSGPSLLDVSHVVTRSALGAATQARIAVRWSALGDDEWHAALQTQGIRTVLNVVSAQMPERLAAALLELTGMDPHLPLAQLPRAARLRLVETLVRGDLPFDGDEGYRKAEVTGGGVDLSEVDPRTLESKRLKGLFLCGEMLDAFGPIGGYNFLWAWATGRAAGLGASRGSG